MFHLEDFDAYYGFISRQFIEKSLAKPGDFLVRYGFTNEGRPQFLISVNSDRRGIINLTLIFDTIGFWYLAEDKGSMKDGFPNVIALVDYYGKNPLPCDLQQLYLKRAILRPRWMLYSNLISMEGAKALGSGNFCVVDKASYMGFPVAVKTCHNSLDLGETDDAIRELTDAKKPEKRTAHIELTDTGIPEAQFQLLEEAEVMRQLHHNHIIEFVGLCCEKPPLRLVMEFCEGGSLQAHLEKMLAAGVKIPDNEMVMYLHQIAQGMEYLESKNMVHRDLACRNVLLDKHGTLKVCDFGMAKMAAAIYGEEFSRSQIPLHGMAPECLQPKPSFTPKSDIWSYGMLVYEQYCYGAHVEAWKDWPLKKIATYIRRAKMPDPPKTLPGVLRDMVMLKCWLKEPQDRAGFSEIVAILQNLVTARYPTPDENETTLCKHGKLLPQTGKDKAENRHKKNLCDGIEDALKMRKKCRLDALGPLKSGPRKIRILKVPEQAEKELAEKKLAESETSKLLSKVKSKCKERSRSKDRSDDKRGKSKSRKLKSRSKSRSSEGKQSGKKKRTHHEKDKRRSSKTKKHSSKKSSSSSKSL